MWQHQSSHPERLDPNRVFGTETLSKGSGDVDEGEPEWGILSPLEPWAGPEAQTLSTGIVKSVHATRPWAPPERMELIKDPRAVVIPRRYDSAMEENIKSSKSKTVRRQLHSNIRRN